MHEFPEVQAMVKQACAQVPSGARVKRLRIVVGEASGHDSHHIEGHFADASRGTPAEGAVLEFVHEKLAAKCATCGTEFRGGGTVLACTRCGGTQLVITAGNTVRLAGIETAP
ncbi:MAG: hydrogenase maturation nickel metallochaperone HypA [Candidatus Acidiferrales bacterium]